VTDKRQKRAAEFIEPFRVNPGSKVTLGKDFDPAFKAGVKKKKEGVAFAQRGGPVAVRVSGAVGRPGHVGVLVVLQAMHTAGKDGTIRHVMSGVNPQGVAVHSFKVPSAEELDHDFLWRYAQRLPARGEIGIFNRSHYEEVLVVRVHPENLDRQKLPKAAKKGDVWKRRYREINDWERYLSDNGFRIVKLFLNVSKEEQRARLLRRIDLPDHNWKFSPADVAERERWDEYQQAFSEVLSHTSTEWAPWYVIPADRKWFARIGAGAVLVHTLREIDPRYPRSASDSVGRCSRSNRHWRRRRRSTRHLTRSSSSRETGRPEGRRATTTRGGHGRLPAKLASPTPHGGGEDGDTDSPRRCRVQWRRSAVQRLRRGRAGTARSRSGARTLRRASSRVAGARWAECVAGRAAGRAGGGSSGSTAAICR
jgi:PPK2 family polyphosphate:nucleotide phosphotransferase